MPNGNPDFNYAELEEYFSPIAEDIIEFSNNQGLHLEKYYHEFPSWALCFNHPKGGQAKLEITRENNDAFSVTSCWWQDDYESFCRNIWDGRKIEFERSSSNVEGHLRQAFNEVLNQEPGKWTKTATGYKRIWGRFTKEEFYGMAPDWPMVR